MTTQVPEAGGRQWEPLDREDGEQEVSKKWRRSEKLKDMIKGTGNSEANRIPVALKPAKNTIPLGCRRRGPGHKEREHQRSCADRQTPFPTSATQD